MKITQQAATVVYGGILHVCGIVAMTVLVATNHVTWAEGGPILGALVGSGVGAGAALLPSGSSAEPSSASGVTVASGATAPAPTTAAVAPVQPVAAAVAPVAPVTPVAPVATS